MTLSYEEIFSDFLGRVTDYEMMSKDDTQVYMMMTECLHKVFKKPYIRRLFASVSLDDEVHDITFEMKNVVSEDEDLDFVQEIASKGMVVEWLEPQVKKTSMLAQMFTGKESTFYSQSAHLAELRGLYEDSRLEVRQMIRDRGYIYNPYLEGTNG